MMSLDWLCSALDRQMDTSPSFPHLQTLVPLKQPVFS